MSRALRAENVSEIILLKDRTGRYAHETDGLTDRDAGPFNAPRVSLGIIGGKLRGDEYVVGGLCSRRVIGGDGSFCSLISVGERKT